VDKIETLVRKEWSEVFKNKLVLMVVAFVPLLFTAIPLVILYSTRGAFDEGGIGFSEVSPDYALLCEGLTGPDCDQYVLVSQFMLLYMILPVMIPVTIASYSIVGEKTTRTLEPLLATPITTIQLLAGKALAAVIPAVAVTWLGFLVFAAGAIIISTSPPVVARFFDPLWLTAIFVVGPLLAVAGVSIAVMISSRTSDPRVAEQISSLVILPLVAVFVAQALGVFILNARIILWVALVLALLDAGLLAFAVQLFQRETILTRWK
jgi:ABC-2 type transport system permease protein